MKIIYNSLEQLHLTNNCLEDHSRLEDVLNEFKLDFDLSPLIPRLNAVEKLLKLAHTEKYIEQVKDATIAVKDPSSVFFEQDIHHDTQISEGTYTAALMGATLAIDAAELAQSGQDTFLITRPPGHHAAKDYTGGFCIFNNCALAARYMARKGFKVFIYDFDAHQGNGTEDIVRITEPQEYLANTKFSVQDIAKIKEIVKSGSRQDIQMIRSSVKELEKYAKPLRRNKTNENIMFLSTHQDEIYPYNDSGSYENIVNIPMLEGIKDRDFMQLLDLELVPRLESFKPHIVIVSAGFDSYYKDAGYMDINGNSTKVNMRLTTSSYKHIKEILAPYKKAFILEGGYNPSSIAEGINALM